MMGTGWEMHQMGSTRRFGQSVPYRQFLKQQVLSKAGPVPEPFMEEVAEALSHYPEEDIRDLQKAKCRFICAPTVTQALPGLKNKPLHRDTTDTFDHDVVGVFHAASRAIVFAQHFIHSQTGKAEPNPDVPATVGEEVAHAIDYVYRVSQSPECQEAYAADLNQMSEPDKKAIAQAWSVPPEDLPKPYAFEEIVASVLSTFRRGKTTDRAFPVLEKFKALTEFVAKRFFPEKGKAFPPRPTSIRIPVTSSS